MLRRLSVFLVVSAFVAFSAIVTNLMQAPQTAAAACRTPLIACAGGLDPSRTSTLRVDHRETPSNDLVEPDTGETWDIEARWSPQFGPCTDTVVNVTADVTKTSTGWSVTCTGCNAAGGPVFSVGICDDSSGCSVDTHGHAYVLKVDVATFNGVKSLNEVIYTTDSIDDGDTLNSTCGSEVSAVSPTSQTFTATDTTFPCSLDCTQDTALTITYD